MESEGDWVERGVTGARYLHCPECGRVRQALVPSARFCGRLCKMKDYRRRRTALIRGLRAEVSALRAQLEMLRRGK